MGEGHVRVQPNGMMHARGEVDSVAAWALETVALATGWLGLPAWPAPGFAGIQGGARG